jgi:hypothetical protein
MADWLGAGAGLAIGDGWDAGQGQGLLVGISIRVAVASLADDATILPRPIGKTGSIITGAEYSLTVTATSYAAEVATLEYGTLIVDGGFSALITGNTYEIRISEGEQ